MLSYIYSKLETHPALNADACLPTSIVTNTTITPTTSTPTTSFNATDSMVFSPMSSIQEQEQVSLVKNNMKLRYDCIACSIPVICTRIHLYSQQ